MERPFICRGEFSLVELLVVIAVIAILAALLLPALGRAKSDSQRINCMSHLKQLQLTWVRYADDYDPDSGYYVDAEQPCYSKLSSITTPLPSQLFVFIDENEGTLEDDQFGYPMENFDYGWWWDMPSNRHNQGADLSFADGNVEYWRWRSPETNTVGPFVEVLTSQIPDYIRVGNALRQVPVGIFTEPPGNSP